MRANPNTVDVNDDWHDRIPSLRLVLDQDKARALGVSTSSLSQALQAHYTGIPAGQFREDDKLIDIVWRAQNDLRTAADQLPDVTVRTGNGRTAPLSQFVKFETVFEDGVRWRRNRFPAISVRADVVDGKMAPDVAAEIIPKLKPIQDQLPTGYFIETGGSKEDAWISQKSILVWIPLVLIVTLILLMMQLQNLSRTFLVFITAPLGRNRRGVRPAVVRRAFRLRGVARHHRPVRHDHAQLGDSGGPDRAGPKSRTRYLDRYRRIDGAAL